MPVVIGGLILSFSIMLLFGGTEFDRALLMLLSAPEAPRWEQAAALIVSAASPTPLLLVTLAGAAYLFIRSRWREALLLLGTALLGRLLVEGLQELGQDFRPGLNERLFPNQQIGFPNGHAANATITGLAVAFLTTRHHPARGLALGAAAACALLVGAGRLLLGASWPSDVIGGWAVGLAWTLLLLRLAGEDLGDGTPRLPRPAAGKESESGLAEN
jgi:undecaprenyl-diphosphatase